MKNIPILCCSLFTAIYLMSCSTPKMVSLDPITIKENAPGLNVYRGSYTRLSDIINTKLDLSFNWDSAYVYGKATIQAKPYFYPSDQITLDANGFRINNVFLVANDEQQPLRYTYNGKKLNIKLDKTYTSEQVYTLVIDYVAMPNKLKVGEDIATSADRGLYFINKDGKDKDKPRQIWSQGETECNSSWFPTINDPQEKMTQEINLTIANEYTSLSNGTLEYSTLNGNGTRTDSWRQEQAHSTYLTMIAVGNFTVTKDMWEEKEVNYYTEPAYASTAKLVFGKTPEMIGFFSEKLGVEYPWDKYSQIVVRDFVSGAMENTTATVFFDRMNMSAGQYLDENHEDIIAHELFHQWFGDLVTAESWSNLPLNESFATYGEYLWEEHKYGRDAADLKGLEDLTAYLSGDRKNSPDVIRYDYADREQMFDEISYQKGGRILHMLRKTVGDAAFFKALNLYLTRNAYKNAEIDHLRLAFEEVSGMDLNWFFNQWFLSSGHPILNIQSTYNQEKKEISVTINQKQDLSKSPLYRIPMAIDIYSGGKVERKEIVLDKLEQTFIFPSQAAPDLVNTDAEKYILGEKTEVKTMDQYIFQYRHAPLFMDRLEAVMMLSQMKNETLAHAALIEGFNDKSWFIRAASLSVVEKLSSDEQKSVYDQVRNIALNDPVSHVRATGVNILGKVYGSQNNRDVFDITRKDPAPSVVKATEDVIGK